MVEEALKVCSVPVQLSVAMDGEVALSLLAKEEAKPDVVILDLNIPKVSGICVLKQYQPKEAPPWSFSVQLGGRLTSAGRSNWAHAKWSTSPSTFRPS